MSTDIEIGLEMPIKQECIMDVMDYLEMFDRYKIYMYRGSPQVWILEWFNYFDEYAELYELFLEMDWIFINKAA